MWKIMKISESSPGKSRKSNSFKPFSGKDLPYIFKSNVAFSEQVRRCHYSQVCVGKKSLYIFPFKDLIAFKNSGSWLFWKETLKGWRCVSNIQGMLLLAKGWCRPISGAMWEAERWHSGHQTEPPAAEQVFLYLNTSTMRALIATVVNLGVSCRVLVYKRLVRDNENDHMKTSGSVVENRSF